ncbi:hypothetical protein ACJ2A9_07215 [Anaerobacillus sp. MEB173]|uniref:hypothetical protein n=1 Tax=Anaerobacillus sp. MEB173 TaxID=3383345 RepID=UPI003F92DF7E
MKKNKIEVLLWSIALPGFGQMLNGHVVKGGVLILLEIIINVCANFNAVIMLSFLGEIDKAIELTNFQWLMFYPCLYMFSIWDAYKEASDDTKPYLFLPFVFAAYFITVGLVYSSTVKIFGVLLGPVWLPMLMVIPGLITGFVIRSILVRFQPTLTENS